MSAAGGRVRGRLSLGVLTLALVGCGLVALLVVAVRGQPPPANRAAQVHQIAAQLRCPVCDDLSVADSPAPLAAQMRQQIADDLAAGRTPEQIRRRFVASYGDSVLLTPPHRGVGQVAYLLPAVVLGAGAVCAALLLRGWLRGSGDGSVPDGTHGGGNGDRNGDGNGGSAAEGGNAAEGGSAVAAGPARLTAADRRSLETALARLREEEE